MSDIFPMDFVGAARSEAEPTINYLSSGDDDRMDCISVDLVDDLISSSDGESEDLEVMKRCVERPLTVPIPIPITINAEKVWYTETKPAAIPYIRPKVFLSRSWKRFNST